jgi:hypothetical protein
MNKDANNQHERTEASSEKPAQGLESTVFPSWRIIISLYSIGALAGLMAAFNPSLSSLQSTNCLVLSWMLALGALGMSVLCERDAEEEYPE